MQIETRPARRDEAALGAHLVFLSGPAVFTYGFARPVEEAERLLAELWPYGGHLFSYSWSHVAVVDGEVQGLLLGYPGTKMLGAGLATARLICGRSGLRQLLRMARNSWLLARTSPWVPGSDYYVGHLAVLPASRGRGIGRHLLALAEALGRQAGCARCALDVFVENRPARALYERAGYTGAHTTTDPRLISATGYSGVLRLVKPLV